MPVARNQPVIPLLRPQGVSFSIVSVLIFLALVRRDHLAFKPNQAKFHQRRQCLVEPRRFHPPEFFLETPALDYSTSAVQGCKNRHPLLVAMDWIPFC
jgi:hypothetical protein